MRNHEDQSQKLQYFDVSLMGLSGKHHPSPSGIINVTKVKKCIEKARRRNTCVYKKRINATQTFPAFLLFAVLSAQSRSEQSSSSRMSLILHISCYFLISIHLATILLADLLSGRRKLLPSILNQPKHKSA